LKEESWPGLDNVVASDLKIYNVSIPKGNPDLLQKIYHKLVHNKHDILELEGWDKVKDIFLDPYDEDIFIIVGPSSKSLSGALTLLFFSTAAPPLCPCTYGC
jgi:hypothetical protein